ncbi:MAG TPA: UDP-3-O-acyl-N-acetylglucosamine deacetylase [Myxococcaceae bacterium]|jgi:UDP-3-O-[3-hydroxymyristoyl] N-acetylglucosamine deacetylase|nr:UDP-3-O-acyl-N-acetylglucosamine deacetylase [Myxococcaceae bacterium]
MSDASFHQRTLEQPVSTRGVGLHSGAQVTLTLRPAPAGHGVVFHRVDLAGSPGIPATAAHVVDTALATTLAKGEARVGTVEHVLAALSGLGIDNVRIEVDGPEVPILDGSSGPFLYLVRSAGIRILEEPKSFVVIRRPVVLREGDREASLSPCDRLRVDCAIDFHHPLVPGQSLSIDFSSSSFTREIARARTFGFLKDVEQMKSAGLARGGSLENAIVVDEFSILNPEGLRYPDEFVRHKTLDALGDLALFGHPVIGHLRVKKSGHALHHRLVSRVMADTSAYAVVRARRRELERLDLRVPDLALALDSI